MIVPLFQAFSSNPMRRTTLNGYGSYGPVVSWSVFWPFGLVIHWSLGPLMPGFAFVLNARLPGWSRMLQCKYCRHAKRLVHVQVRKIPCKWIQCKWDNDCDSHTFQIPCKKCNAKHAMQNNAIYLGFSFSTPTPPPSPPAGKAPATANFAPRPPPLPPPASKCLHSMSLLRLPRNLTYSKFFKATKFSGVLHHPWTWPKKS